MMVRNHLDDQAMSKLLMKSTHNKKVLEAHKKVLEAHKKVLEAHKIVLEAHKSFRFSSILLEFLEFLERSFHIILNI